jgi:circadian clock protein KaiC
LRYVEVNGELRRTVSVLKARGVRHDARLRLFQIDERGPSVGAPFQELRGVTTKG